MFCEVIMVGCLFGGVMGFFGVVFVVVGFVG